MLRKLLSLGKEGLLLFLFLLPERCQLLKLFLQLCLLLLLLLSLLFQIADLLFLVRLRGCMIPERFLDPVLLHFPRMNFFTKTFLILCDECPLLATSSKLNLQSGERGICLCCTPFQRIQLLRLAVNVVIERFLGRIRLLQTVTADIMLCLEAFALVGDLLPLNIDLRKCILRLLNAKIHILHLQLQGSEIIAALLNPACHRGNLLPEAISAVVCLLHLFLKAFKRLPFLGKRPRKIINLPASSKQIAA